MVVMMMHCSLQHLVLPVNDAFHHMPAPTPMLPYTSSPRKWAKKNAKRTQSNVHVLKMKMDRWMKMDDSRWKWMTVDENG